MHHIYQTEGFVLTGQNFGEANRFLSIFTKDLGMISGTAQGVRLLKSKLRYSLREFSYSSISLVRGKELWRITGAQKKGSAFDLLEKDEQRFQVFVRGLTLLRRFLHGEEKNERLFSLFSRIFTYLNETEKISATDLQNVECILVMRVLQDLGYLKKVEILQPFSETSEWNQELLLAFIPFRKNALEEINRSMKESHL